MKQISELLSKSLLIKVVSYIVEITSSSLIYLTQGFKHGHCHLVIHS